MKKSNNLFRPILKGLLCSLLLLISCNEDDTQGIKEDDVTDVVVVYKASATEASIASSTPLRRTEYNFSYNANRPIKIEVVNYNENYAYELKLTGVYLKKQYIVSLSKQAVMVDSEGDNAKMVVKEKLAAVSPVKDIETPTSKTTLVANVENLQMEADAYTAVLVEKESKTELALGGGEAKYTILDIDSPYFLTTTQIESDRWAKLTTLDLSVSRFRVRPANNVAPVGYISGVGVQLSIYDTDLKYIGKVNSNGSNGVTGKGTYSYKFNSSNVNALIPSNGEYLFRLDESIPTTPVAGKIYKKGVFQKIQVKKATTNNAIVALKAI